MDSVWAPLETEFAAWRAAGMVLPFWWRDDDAIAATPALERLVAMSDNVGVLVHLAVIPTMLEPSLIGAIGSAIPVTHGYVHRNHAAEGQKKCEFPAERSLSAVRAEIETGFKTLMNSFDNVFAPMFVPPWNRFDLRFVNALQEVGYKGFSTSTPRKNRWISNGVEQVNTHLDPIDWHGTRSVVEPSELVARTVTLLADRRKRDNSEPFGFLTHHLVHDAAIWDFSTAFLERMMAGPTRMWTARELE